MDDFSSMLKNLVGQNVYVIMENRTTSCFRGIFRGILCPADDGYCIDWRLYHDRQEFNNLKTDKAECLFFGEVNPDFAEKVKNGGLNVCSQLSIITQIPEGVVCKSGQKHELIMCKIKTQLWLNAIKNIDNWEEIV